MALLALFWADYGAFFHAEIIILNCHPGHPRPREPPPPDRGVDHLVRLVLLVVVLVRFQHCHHDAPRHRSAPLVLELADPLGGGSGKRAAADLRRSPQVGLIQTLIASISISTKHDR